ncbi:RecQ family ATP-dependent DNA helicase [Patescibacteria group bacterium]|nr:RecQ family ATP-dependent DNA helicase [Patescibacteria group bacterium]
MIDKKRQLLELLKIHFNYGSFRPGQEKAIDSILNGQNTITVLPTGGGKSMIFQLPSLVLEGITLVVSPLIALMKDQVDSLEKVGIPATFINSSVSPQELALRLEKIRSSYYRLVYIAPERFYNQAFISELKKINVSLLAIDEAHCISQWGHDFRPSYLRLKEAIKLCGSPPVAALTATATPEVREDIARQLGFKEYELIISGFSRPNLQFAAVVTNNSRKMEYIFDAISSQEGESGIVYVGTRSKADEIVEYLSDHGIKAVSYHAGIDSDSRAWVQEQFMQGQAQVVVATNAFGLGINKKNIRFVIHHDLPGTLEAYYQEAGRAGRDGLTSFCILFYSPSDRYLQEFFISGDNPSPNMIKETYQYLLDAHAEKADAENSILITYAEIGQHLSESAPDMAIGTAIKILEKEGYVSRPNERTSNTYVKLLSTWDELIDSISTRAKVQLVIAEKLREKYEKELMAGWQFSAEEVAVVLHVKKEVLNRAIKKLAEQELLKYRPPFKGTEIRILKFVSPDDLSLNFKALELKAEHARNKLNEMEAYVYSNTCRQQYILKYFGENDAKACGACDNCLRKHKLPTKEYLGDY